MNSFLPKFLLGCVVAVALGFASGCSNQFVQSASVQSTTDGNGDVLANLSLQLNTNGVMLPALQVPILDPKNSGTILGKVGIQPMLNGATQFDAAVNLTKVAHVQAIDGHLMPNGHLVPIGGLEGVPAIAIPAGGGTNPVEIYLALNSSTAMIGAAIPIKEFSQIAKYVGGLDFFPAFNFSNGVRGVAGIYTSAPGVDKNGLAFFVDASAVLAHPKVAAQLASTDRSLDASEPVELDYSGHMPSTSKQRKFWSGFMELNQSQAGRPVTIGQ